MKRRTLRFKIAFSAAALGVFSTLAGAITTWTFMRIWEIQAFDKRLALDAQELFRDIENFEGGSEENRRSFQERFVPLALRNRLIEIYGQKGELLYRSPDIRGPMNDGVDAIHTCLIDGRRVRMGSFHWAGLTLRVGASMREVDQIGKDIALGMVYAIPTVLVVIFI